MNANPFGRRSVVVLATLMGLSLVAGLVALALPGEERVELRSADANAYSYSALGHRAFLALLRRSGIPVLVSRHVSAQKASEGGGLLLLAEPQPWRAAGLELELERTVSNSERTLLVLPKWTGVRDPGREGWIARARLLGSARVEDVMELAGLDGELVRLPEGGQSWKGELGPAPTLARPQLVKSRRLVPLIECREGVLFGRLRADQDDDTERYVLTDPDLLSNHGLDNGRNAELALALVQSLVAEGHTVVVDETAHGFRLTPSLWAEIFRFPLVLTFANAVLCAGLLLWAGTRRFGSPLPPPPPLEAGKRTLIDNTAELLLAAGHGGHALERYLHQGVRSVARAHHVPEDLEPAERDERLARIGERMGVSNRPEELDAEVDAAGRSRSGRARQTLRAARAIHRWREEMLHGTG